MNAKEKRRIFATARVWIKTKPRSFKQAEVLAMAVQLLDMKKAIEEHLESREWRDISTAPRDEVIELAGPVEKDGRFLHCLHASWGKTIFGFKGWFCARSHRRLTFSGSYTHWRPSFRAEPPKAKKDK